MVCTWDHVEDISKGNIQEIQDVMEDKKLSLNHKGI